MCFELWKSPSRGLCCREDIGDRTRKQGLYTTPAFQLSVLCSVWRPGASPGPAVISSAFKNTDEAWDTQKANEPIANLVG